MKKYAIVVLNYDNHNVEVSTVCDTLEEAKSKLIERVEKHIERCKEEYGADELEQERWVGDLHKQTNEVREGKVMQVWDWDCEMVVRIVELGKEIPLP